MCFNIVGLLALPADTSQVYSAIQHTASELHKPQAPLTQVCIEFPLHFLPGSNSGTIALDTVCPDRKRSFCDNLSLLIGMMVSIGTANYCNIHRLTHGVSAPATVEKIMLHTWSQRLLCDSA